MATSLGHISVIERPKFSVAERMSQLVQSCDFDLANALARYLEYRSYFFQSALATFGIEPESIAQNVGFARSQKHQRFFDQIAQFAMLGIFRRTQRTGVG